MRAVEAKEYEASLARGALQAPNRRHDLRTYFSPTGVRVVERSSAEGKHLLTLEGLRVGRGAALDPIAPGTVRSEGARVEIVRPGIVEWYQNSAAGLEQGFTIETRPGGEGEVVLELDVEGATVVPKSADRIDLRSEAGRKLAFSGLRVDDARGVSLAAHFEARPGGYRIVFDDREAQYPVVVDPLLTGTFDSELESNQIDAFFGTSVASAGDVDGDGFEDVIVGAPSFDNGQLDEGAAFVFLGTAAGLADGNPISAHALLESNQADARFGTCVAGAGDVNGDGYADVIVGAPLYDSGQVNEGAAFVFHGGPAGIGDGDPSTAAAVLESDQAGALFGAGLAIPSAGVASAGDVNGDGYSDVIVGATLYDAGQDAEGAAFLYHGGPSGIGNGNPANADGRIESNQASAFLGGFVASAGDVNGDTFADVIVGARAFDNGQTNEGAAFVFHGSFTGIGNRSPTTSDALIESNEAEGIFEGAVAVASAGDVNGDGYSDVIVGFAVNDIAGPDAGMVLIVHGSAAGVPDASPTNADGFSSLSQSGALFGSSVAPAGDVNGDGYGDVVIGSRGFDGTQIDEGAAWVMLGGPTGVVTSTPYATLTLGQANAQVGSSVASAGDVNGDGFDDILVGVALYDGPQVNEGEAFVFLGGGMGVRDATALGADARIESDQTEAWLGWSVASAGDVNGDGFGDVIVGAFFYDAGQTDEGAAFVFLGSAAGLPDGGPGSVHAQLESNQVTALFGQSVASAGDVNGDGFGDVIVGAPEYDAGQSDEGAAFIFLGSAAGLADGDPTSAHAQLESDQPFADFGKSVASAGDVNGDGFGDVIVGAENYDAGESNEGAAFVFLGSAAGLSDGNPAAAHAVYQSNQVLARLGSSVASAGDINGDRFGDVIIGADEYDAGESDEGAAFIFLGSAAGLADGDPTTAHAQIESNQASAFLGESVASAGDVNGDGFGDVIVGAGIFDSGESREGIALVFLGSATGIPDGNPFSAHAGLQSEQANAWFGRSVASAGDVNGDGFGDVIVGARMYSAGQSSEGAAFIFLGSAAGLASGDPTTAHAQLESNQSNAQMGSSVASAGDVNGDGFGDVIVGAFLYDAGQTDEGAAFVFLGSPGTTAPARPRQLRDDGTGLPIAPGGTTGAPDSFRVQLRGERHPSGILMMAKLEVEACPPGVPFRHASCVLHRSPSWRELPLQNDWFEDVVSGLPPDQVYRWRARMIHAPWTVVAVGETTPPPNPRGGPWRRIGGGSDDGRVRVVPEPGIGAGLIAGVLTLSAGRIRRSRSLRRARRDVSPGVFLKTCLVASTALAASLAAGPATAQPLLVPDSAGCVPALQCGDGLDNDGDGFTDLGDGDCASLADASETAGGEQSGWLVCDPFLATIEFIDQAEILTIPPFVELIDLPGLTELPAGAGVAQVGWTPFSMPARAFVRATSPFAGLPDDPAIPNLVFEQTGTDAIFGPSGLGLLDLDVPLPPKLRIHAGANDAFTGEFVFGTQIVSLAASTSLPLDDFETGPRSVVLTPPAPGQSLASNRDPGTMIGGFRQSVFESINSTTTAKTNRFDVVAGGPLRVQSDAGLFHRLSLYYGRDQAGNTIPLDLDLSLYSALHLRFGSLAAATDLYVGLRTGTLVDSTRIFSLAPQAGPFELTIPLVDFGIGSGLADIDRIALIFESDATTPGTQYSLTQFLACAPGDRECGERVFIDFDEETPGGDPVPSGSDLALAYRDQGVLFGATGPSVCASTAWASNDQPSGFGTAPNVVSVCPPPDSAAFSAAGSGMVEARFAERALGACVEVQPVSPAGRGVLQAFDAAGLLVDEAFSSDGATEFFCVEGDAIRSVRFAGANFNPARFDNFEVRFVPEASTGLGLGAAAPLLLALARRRRSPGSH
ncbi:MAG: FG-GAP repeat protein [Deltaproteobacteria bacterium]|nr:FG-GAP repeat protein [Deltaproteobacteria bacterium]